MLELRRSVISAVGNSIDQQPAFAFLLNVAKNDRRLGIASHGGTTDWDIFNAKMRLKS